MVTFMFHEFKVCVFWFHFHHRLLCEFLCVYDLLCCSMIMLVHCVTLK